MRRDEAEAGLNRLAVNAKATKFEIGRYVDTIRRHRWWEEWHTTRGVEAFTTYGAWCRAILDAPGRTVNRWCEGYTTLVRYRIAIPSGDYDQAVRFGHSCVGLAGLLADGSRNAFLRLLRERPSHRDLQYRLGYDDRRAQVLESFKVYLVRRTLPGGAIRYLTSNGRFANSRRSARRFDAVEEAWMEVNHPDMSVISLQETLRLEPA